MPIKKLENDYSLLAQSFLPANGYSFPSRRVNESGLVKRHTSSSMRSASATQQTPTISIYHSRNSSQFERSLSNPGVAAGSLVKKPSQHNYDIQELLNAKDEEDPEEVQEVPEVPE